MATPTTSTTQPAKFLEGDLMRHVMVMSFTSSIGLVALFFVDLVDMWFISMLGEPALVSAIGYASSILFFLTSVGIGLAIATGALVARSLGQGRPDRAKQYASHVLAVAFAGSALSSALVFLFSRDLLALLGASGQALDAGTMYLQIIVPSTPVLVMGMASGAVLRGHGDATRAMWTTLTGGLVNAGLDPIFIFGFDWGLAGAAWASFVSRFFVLGTALFFVFGKYEGLSRPTLGGLRLDIVAIFGIAGPAVLTNIATPIGQAIVTRAMSEYGDPAVAAMTVIGRLTPVAFGVIFALSGAVGPIVGQNFGGYKYDRVRGTLFAALKFCTVFVLVVSALLFLFRGLISDVFRATDEARTLIFLFCGPLSLMFVFNGILFCSNASFNNLNRPLWSTALNWGRNTIGMALPVWWLSSSFGAAGVLVGQTLGGLFFGLLGIWLAFKLVDHYEKQDASGDPPEPSSKPSLWRALNPLSKSR